ncbi:SDR family oxidoreductase [Paenibacillus sp. GCM10027626]|uniref:SDR family oxidoreductase n=1 Tax=Paenibacillus sp. GCM10027626 TaxID=3273411 RepID=UPI0036326D41
MEPDLYRQMFGLQDQVAIVTGASRGLGQSMALALGRAGAAVCIVGRQPNLDKTKQLMNDYGVDYIEVLADLTCSQGIQSIIDATMDRWGKVDTLVNNAGTFLRKPSIEWTMEEWDFVVNVNLRAVFEICQAAGKIMLRRKSGKIVNIASILGFQGGYICPAYAASRHGVLGLTKALANEWAEHGINVNAICPGYMDTDQNIDLFNDPIRSKELFARIPAKRWGSKSEIDGACLFLSSSASDYMNGQVVTVDGGWMGR